MRRSIAPSRGWLFIGASLVVLVLFVVKTASATSAEEAARRREAKQHLTAGKKLLRDNFATDAVAELEKSLELYPTPEAEEELAAANRVLGRTLAARANYDSILTTYGSILKAKEREDDDVFELAEIIATGHYLYNIE